jgi:hypothetical protein
MRNESWKRRAFLLEERVLDELTLVLGALSSLFPSPKLKPFLPLSSQPSLLEHPTLVLNKPWEQERTGWE